MRCRSTTLCVKLAGIARIMHSWLISATPITSSPSQNEGPSGGWEREINMTTRATPGQVFASFRNARTLWITPH